jgi:hypothetical protein
MCAPELWSGHTTDPGKECEDAPASRARMASSPRQAVIPDGVSPTFRQQLLHQCAQFLLQPRVLLARRRRKIVVGYAPKLTSCGSFSLIICGVPGMSIEYCTP